MEAPASTCLMLSCVVAQATGRVPPVKQMSMSVLLILEQDLVVRTAQLVSTLRGVIVVSAQPTTEAFGVQRPTMTAQGHLMKPFVAMGHASTYPGIMPMIRNTSVFATMVGQPVVETQHVMWISMSVKQQEVLAAWTPLSLV